MQKTHEQKLEIYPREESQQMKRLYSPLPIAYFLLVQLGLSIPCVFFFLSPVALLVVLGYSVTKRFTALCHLVLGLGLSLAPIGAYLVVTGEFALLPILFSLAVLCWVSGFDIIYALQDEDFDRAQSLHSIPSYLGKKNALAVSNLLHVLAAIFVIAPILFTPLSWPYFIGLGVFIFMLVYQHTLVKPSDLSKVNFAFMTTNGIASVAFALCFLFDIYYRTQL
jgi:4-hydroxybenzoate polyprenyltransferase